MELKKFGIVVLLIMFIQTGCSKQSQSQAYEKKYFNVNLKKIAYQAPAEKIPKTQDLQIFDKRSTENLPWESDARFLAAIKEYNTPKRIASFKATLHDPIGAEIYNISHAADELAGRVVKPGEIFSQNKSIGPYSKEKGYKAGPMYVGNNVTSAYGGGVCKIATLLFNVAILSDVEIIQRHTHSMTVPYVPPGQDATVYYGAKDVCFRNNTEGNIIIWSRMVGNTLYMAMYGTKEPPKVEWHHVTLKRTPFTTIYKKNTKLKKGEEKTLIQGHEGVVVRSSIVVSYPEGKKETRNFGEKYYAPCSTVIEYN